MQGRALYFWFYITKCNVSSFPLMFPHLLLHDPSLTLLELTLVLTPQVSNGYFLTVTQDLNMSYLLLMLWA